MSDCADSILAEQCIAGDHDAFEVLFHRYEHPLRAFVFRYIRDEEQTSDIMQHVFLQLYLSLPKLGAEGSLRAWLYQVARNRSFDELRRRQKRHLQNFSELELCVDGEDISFLERIADPRPLPEEVIELRDCQDYMLLSAQKLPPKSYAIVLLRCLKQLSYNEIAQELEMSAATARTTFLRAKPLLRAALAARD